MEVWDALTCSLSMGGLKWVFLESGLSKSFKVWNFRNKVAMTIIFFSNCLKLDVDSRKRTKKREKFFGFKDNCILIGDNQFSQSKKAYFSLAVNMLQTTRTI